MHVVRAAAHSALRGILTIPHDAELGRQHHLVPAVGNGPTYEQLVIAESVHVGRVKQGDVELQRAMDGRDRLALIRAAVELRHAHASQPLG